MPDLDLSRYPVLVVDDEKDNLDVIRFNFKKVHPLHFAGSGKEALEILKENDVAVIVSDQRMPEMTGLELLKKAREARPEAVGMLLTAYSDVPVFMEAINSGLVYRYVQKPFRADELGAAIRQAVERYHLWKENKLLTARLAEQNEYLKKEEAAPYNQGELVGESPALTALVDVIKQVAPTPASVLLRGESGTGKELLARMIHNLSPRAKKPFVRVNCAALAPGVLESELFGHEKGSFTGAVAKKLGRFELADEGTIFLDEIGELAPEIQVKLLRVLQEREFERVGGVETLKVDVRVISATNRNLEEAMTKGEFREDLFYRLNVFPVRVPPLRDRPEDIERLAAHFLARYADRFGKNVSGLSDAAVQKLAGYSWPGNVRELENVVERAVILARKAEITDGELDFGTRAAPAGEPPRELNAALGELEKRRLLEAMQKHNGRKADVARELGINRSTLYYRLKKYGLDA
jgi:DNA-binding NtrC family response regulator